MAKIITSVKRALEILELFLGGADSISMPEITDRLKMPRTTVHDLVQTLLAYDYLERTDGQQHRYKLGLRVFELGSAYAAKLDIAEIGQVIAKKVSAACDETVQMAILDGTEAVFIIREDSSHILRLVSMVGTRLPAHCTAVGKMLLSALSEQQLAALYKDGDHLPGMTANSITSLSRLRNELADIRKRGYAYDDCESNPDARCVSAPIYDRKGKICAAMSITVPVTRMKAARKMELVEIVRGGAEELSRRLGYKPDPKD
jgi:DNA-binding IclR family transcriptional regulator